jgi:hypothetical protein
VALDEGVYPLAKRHLDGRSAKTMATQGVGVGDTRTNLRKEEKPRKLG